MQNKTSSYKLARQVSDQLELITNYSNKEIDLLAS